MTEAWREEIRKEAERIHESAMCASEAQFAYAKRWRWVDWTLRGIAAFVAAIAGVAGLSDLVSARWAGLVAIISAGIGAVAASLGAARIKEKASVSANAYRNLQQDARIFLNIDLALMSQDDARERLQVLVESQQQLNRDADIPSQGAWAKAQENIDKGAQDYKADR